MVASEREEPIIVSADEYYQVAASMDWMTRGYSPSYRRKNGFRLLFGRQLQIAE